MRTQESENQGVRLTCLIKTSNDPLAECVLLHIPASLGHARLEVLNPGSRGKKYGVGGGEASIRKQRKTERVPQN
jgi:hypothetical protein